MQRTCTTKYKRLLTGAMLGLILAVWMMPAQAQEKSPQAAIRKVMEKQTECWNRGDIRGFMQTYLQSDSLCFVGKKDMTYGWQNALQRYEKSYPNATAMGKLHFTLQQVKLLSPKYAFVAGHWHLTRSAGDLEGEFTLLLQKINGQWKIIVDHSS